MSLNIPTWASYPAALPSKKQVSALYKVRSRARVRVRDEAP